MKVLFVCNQNQNRSKTAKELFKRSFITRSAGLYCKKPLSDSQLSWADLIIVMEESQRTEISKRFPAHYLKKQILSLDVPDIYKYNQQELINILNEKIVDLQPLFKLMPSFPLS